MGSTDTSLLRWQRGILLAVVAALILASLVSYRLVRELRATSQNVLYEDAERLRNVEALSIAVYNRSSNARGYLLSGDASFLEACLAARAEIKRRLPRLREIPGPDVASLLEQLDGLYARLDVATTRAIATFPTSPELARSDWEANARPIQLQIEKLVAQLLAGQVAAFESARRSAAESSERSLLLVISLLLSIAAVVSVLIYAYARVTRSLLARQRAEQQQATFRLLEQVPVGIFVASPDGKPYYANQHAQRLLGKGVVNVGPGGLSRTYSVREVGTDREYPNERLRSCARSPARPARSPTSRSTATTTSSLSTSPALPCTTPRGTCYMRSRGSRTCASSGASRCAMR
jgi:PAS domain-containing protein